MMSDSDTYSPQRISYFLNIPAKALNYSSRIRLALNLNIKQVLHTKKGLNRDYRGLAELMKFQYNDIKYFERSDDPAMKILDAWGTRSDATVGQLMQFLEEMERFDILKEMYPQFEENCEAYLQSQSQLQEMPIQVPEVTSCPVDLRCEGDLNVLTRGDMKTGARTYYDAYVCYADEDVGFVYELANYLESPEVGLKLFIRGRDLLAGHAEHDTNILLIKERCKRMLIILSPEFLKSPACEFQTSFAAGLAIEQRQRMLIPIVLAPCEIPLILKYVSKIDFTKPDIQVWVWEKLISSLQDINTSMFISSPERSPPAKNYSLPQLESGVSDMGNPFITFPPSLSLPSIQSHSTAVSISTSSSCASTSVTYPEGTVNGSALNPAKPAPKQKWRFRWSSPLKGRFSVTNDSSSSASISSSSGATSGFHSHSANAFESLEVPREVCSSDTPV